jgi:hypothetical protein
MILFFSQNCKSKISGLTRTSKQNWIHERFFLIPNGTFNAETGEQEREPFLLTADALKIPG